MSTKRFFERVSFICLGIFVCFVIFQIYFYVFLPNKNRQLPLCPNVPPNLTGPFQPDMLNETLDSVETRLAFSLHKGGYFKPIDCIARNRVAVLVTCRDREGQMPIFLKNLHALLQRQQLEYQMFIVFQPHGFWFNKGALYNVGFIEALKIQAWDCFVFHDIDMVPMDDRNLYDCPRVNPRHLAVDLDKFGYKYVAFCASFK